MKTLMAGLFGTEYYLLDDNNEVFLLDAERKPHKVSDSLAKKVIARIGKNEDENAPFGDPLKGLEESDSDSDS